MNCIGTYDGTIFYNPANKFCIVSVKTADQSVPAEARSNRRYKDHLIRFTAVGYEIPRTDAVELELDGEWAKGKYGVQLQVEQWREIVPRTKNGVEGYLASGLIKGIGPKTAADIVERFGVDTLDILEHQPERLLEIRGITENKLEDIKASYAENRMLQGIMTLLAPFKITPKTALKIYQYFGPTSVEILEKSPFELCQISGFGFRRVDAIVQKSGGNLHDPMRIKGAVFCALDEGKSKRGHLYISSEELEKSALKLLNEKIPVPELRLHQQEVRDMMQEMILNGAIVSVKDNIYLPRVFAQEDETARRIAQRLVAQMPVEHIAPVLEQVKVEMGLRLSAQQEAAVYAAFRHGLSVITGSPGTGKTTVLRTILEVYRRLHPDGKIALMAPTGRASRRMSESTGFEDARTLHSGLGLTSEEDEGSRNRKSEPLSADLIIVDEFSMVDIYQLCLSETQTVPFAFKRLDALHKAGYEQPPAAAYQTVWSAEVCCPKGQNDMEVLGRLFLDFNEHLPEDYRGRPLAPSDVVELDCQGKRTYFYVNDCRDFAPVRFSPFLCKRLPEPAQKQE